MSTTESVKRTRTGRVTSNKADKTVTVLLERQVKHLSLIHISEPTRRH